MVGPGSPQLSRAAPTTGSSAIKPARASMRGMAVGNVPDLALLDNESRRDAYLTHAKLRDLDAHPSFRPMVAELVARYKADNPDLFTAET